jgi:hypothetical protein
MGDNPETNVVDEWGFSHEAPNVGLLGGSAMTLTIQALAGVVPITWLRTGNASPGNLRHGVIEATFSYFSLISAVSPFN